MDVVEENLKELNEEELKNLQVETKKFLNVLSEMATKKRNSMHEGNMRNDVGYVPKWLTED
jgi:hypothetical protein